MTAISITAVLQCNALFFVALLVTKAITGEFWLRGMIVAEIEDMLKERKAEDILDTESKLVAPVDSRVVGNNRVLDTIEPDTKINIPTKDNIKLIEFNNTTVKDSKSVDIAKVDTKLDILINNIVLNKNKDTIVNRAVSVINIKLSSIDTSVTAF